MKILSINSLTQSNYAQNYKKETQIENEKRGISISRGLNYPKGFVPYFGERLNRTPENFYEQEFNKKGMPYTLKKHLESNYEVNKLKRPMDLNKEAFADLELCESIEDVKEMFPDEPLFANLKTLETIRPKQGYLRDLRMINTKNNEVLSTGEDLTVYLLKKVFLEGKDIEEINHDFERDMKPELKVENATKEGAYFLHSTLRSLGVHLPDKSYWASLQATRLDKEYIPTTWTLTKPRKKPVFTKPRVSKPLNLSPEERKRRSEMMINRWIDMSPAQRLSQLAKMKEGQLNSVFYKHNGAIMLIATERANFSDKMYHFFQEKGNGVNCPEDINNPDKKQFKVMQAFWAENQRLRKSFSYHLGATMREFEDAINSNNDEALVALLEKADNIKKKNDTKKLKRQLSNPEFVKKEIIGNTQEQSVYLPTAFNEKYIKFLMNHKRFNDEIVPTYARLTYARTEEEKNAIFNKVQNSAHSIFAEFASKNKRDSISANAALLFVLRPLMEAMADKMITMGFSEKGKNMLYEAFHMMTGSTSNLVNIIQKYHLSNAVKENKHYVEKMMECYTHGLDDDETKIFADDIMAHMRKTVNRMNENCYQLSDNFELVVKRAGYSTLANKEVQQRCKKYLPRVLKDIERNKNARRIFLDFIRNYEGMLLYVNDLVRDSLISPNPATRAKRDIYEESKKYIYESIIDDLLVEYSKNN